MKQTLTIFALLLLLSVLRLPGYGSAAATQQTVATSSSSQVMPEIEKIRDISVGYSPEGNLSKFLFIGYDGQIQHWLEVWKLKNTSVPNIVNYVIKPGTIITWGERAGIGGRFQRPVFAAGISGFWREGLLGCGAEGEQTRFSASGPGRRPEKHQRHLQQSPGSGNTVPRRRTSGHSQSCQPVGIKHHFSFSERKTAVNKTRMAAATNRLH